MKRTARIASLAGATALVLAGCGSPPAEDAGDDGSAAGEDFRACMVTDSGGVDDRSFNQTSWEGIQQAEDEYGIDSAVLESNSNADFVPNINQFVGQDCDLITTVGFLLADATAQAAQDNPDQSFAIVDFLYEESVDNVKPLVFNTAEAAFMAGYLSAGMSESGTVATYGGVKVPTVTIFMDGYSQGVDHYNQQNDADVEVLGWNPDSQNGSFTGDFTDQNKGKTLTENFIRQGADIVMPVAGPVGLGTAAAAQEADDVKVVWVDTDGCESASQYCDVFLTSVKKAMDVAVKTTIESAINDEYDSEPYIGTLENGGVELAPFHEFEGEVPDELKTQLDEVESQIVSGDIEIESPAQPGQ